MISLIMWNVKYGTNELIYKMGVDSERANLWLSKGKERGGIN